MLDQILVAAVVLCALAYLGWKLFGKKKTGCSSCAPTKRKP